MPFQTKNVFHCSIRISLGVSFCIAAFSSSAAAAAFYVSPIDGSDSHPGTMALPFATIERAKQAVRGVNTQMSQDIMVWLRGGIYRTPRPITFAPEDSGMNGFHVRYAAYPDEKPILSGGVRIKGWQVSDPVQKIYVAGAQGQKFRQLYVGDTHGIRSRYPDLNASPNFLRASSIFKGGDGSLHIDVDSVLLGAGLKHTLASTSYQSDVEIVMYYLWNMSRLRILRGAPVAGTNLYRLVIASPDGQLELIKSQLVPGSAYEPQGQNFFLDNHRGFLNQPNEWYLDTASDLVYFRAPDTVTSAADVEALGIVVPMGRADGDNETLISVQGRTATNEPVHHITFERLIFAHTNWLGPSYSAFVGSWATTRYVVSASDPSGAVVESAPAAVQLDYTENIDFSGNVFQNLGGGGINVAGTTKDFRAIGNAFLEVNGNGIQVSGVYGTAPKDRFLVESNLFRVMGWDYHGTAIRTSGVFDLRIRHNEIDFTTHAAIITRGGSGAGTDTLCFGNSALSGVTGNQITANKINRPATRVFDMGATYNPCKQTLAITYNTITNVSAPAWYSHLSYYSLYGGMGVYLDFGSYDVTVKGNTFSNVPHPFHLNCESNNVIANNRTDLAPGTEDSTTPRRCVAQPQVYGPSTTAVADSNSSTVPAIPAGIVVGMRRADRTFLAWLYTDVNKSFPLTSTGPPLLRDHIICDHRFVGCLQ